MILHPKELSTETWNHKPTLLLSWITNGEKRRNFYTGTGFGKSSKVQMLVLIKQIMRGKPSSAIACESTRKLIHADFDLLHGRLAFSGVSRVHLTCFNRDRCRCTCYLLDKLIQLAQVSNLTATWASDTNRRCHWSNLTANFAQNNKAIFPLQGFENVLRWRLRLPNCIFKGEGYFKVPLWSKK